MDYDTWIMTPPYPDDEECECGEPDCTCAEDAQDAAEERGDALFHAQQDREHEEAQS